MKTSSIALIVIAILVILGGWYAYSTYYSGNAVPSTATTINTNTSGDYYPNGAPGSTSSTTNATSSTTVTASTTVKTGITVGTSTNAKITLTATGFSPKTITIKKGTTVTWTNTGTGTMWVASGQHPTHTTYDGTNEQTHCVAGYTGAKPFDECKNATTYSFTFDKVGTWNFHNHSNASQFGTVIVQ